jgi:hypothetical protein
VPLKRRRLSTILVVLSVALLAALGWWRFGTREVPPGQPPLATLDASSIAALQDDFNRAAGQTRIIVLLSPT